MDVASLVIDPEGRWFRIGDEEVQLGRRRVLHRILRRLAASRSETPGAPVSHDELFAAGWPAERALRSAAENRIRVAMATLRALGLRRVLKTGDRSY
ncbi:hypothetical protein L6R52_41930, partial [Myxococcota bacterium]|nr:hypothetical protein [Myxococcota bacterium]